MCYVKLLTGLKKGAPITRVLIYIGPIPNAPPEHITIQVRLTTFKQVLKTCMQVQKTFMQD